MKVKWTLLVDDACGQVDKKHYARHIPGNGEWAAVCNKPELSEKTKKKKAELPVATNFKTLIATCKNILNNPAARAMWQARYDEAKGTQTWQAHSRAAVRLCAARNEYKTQKRRNGRLILQTIIYRESSDVG